MPYRTANHRLPIVLALVAGLALFSACAQDAAVSPAEPDASTAETSERAGVPEEPGAGDPAAASPESNADVGTIEGVVLAGGSPVSQASLWFETDDGRVVGAASGPDGRYRIVNAPSGERTMRLQVGGSTHEIGVEVRGGDTSTVDLELDSLQVES